MFSYIYLVLFLFGTTTSFKTSSFCRNRLYTLSNTPLPDTNASLKNALKKENNNISWKTLAAKAVAAKAKEWMYANKNKLGFPWKEYYDLGANNMKILHQNYLKINNPSIVYPDYYTQMFHYYDEGNLNWEAALEVVPTTLLIASRYWNLGDVLTSQSWMRGNTTSAIQKHIDIFPSNQPNTGRIMDIACSVGISTKYLIEAFPNKEGIDAVDLSPHFLSVARFIHTTPESPIFTTLHEKITYHHMMAEDMSFESNSYDIVSISFLLHEVPTKSAEEIITEAYRVLRPGGVLCVMDIDGKVAMNKFLFELSEPHIKQYYNTNPMKIMEDAGFTFIETKKNDPRNLLWIGSKPEQKEVKTMTDLEWEELFKEVHKFH